MPRQNKITFPLTTVGEEEEKSIDLPGENLIAPHMPAAGLPDFLIEHVNIGRILAPYKTHSQWNEMQIVKVGPRGILVYVNEDILLTAKGRDFLPEVLVVLEEAVKRQYNLLFVSFLPEDR